MSQGIAPLLRSAICAVLVLSVLGLATPAQAQGPEGTWIGTMKTADGNEFDVTLVLDGTGATWTGTLTDQDDAEMPLENLRVTATRISFTFRPQGGSIPAHFTGGYIPGDNRITGTFSLRGNSRFVRFRPAPGQGITTDDSAEESAAPSHLRHDYKFGINARVAYWPALHVVKDEIYSINNLTKSTVNFDAALRWLPLDGLAVVGRYYRGGFGITDDPSRLEPFAPMGLTKDSYLTMDGFEFGVMGYLGNVMMRNSKFNPYITGMAGRVSWEMTESGRGSAPILIDRVPLTDTSWSFAFGLGTEYGLSPNWAIEFEWLWRYYMTKDETKWQDTDVWGNTHGWSVALGLTWGFF